MEDFNAIMNNFKSKEDLYKRKATDEYSNISVVDLDRAIQKALNCPSVQFQNKSSKKEKRDEN